MKNPKKIVIMGMAVITAVSAMSMSASVSLAATAPASAFYDVSASDPNYEAIASIGKMGIINGYADGSYKPDSFITKAELSVIVSNCTWGDNYDSYNVHEYFDDVSSDHWAAQYISHAAVCGCFSTFNYTPFSTIYTGSAGTTFINIENRTFSPDSYATYEEAVKAIITLQGYNVVAEQKYTGEDKYIQCAKEFGILDGMENIDYNAYATRGNIARIVYNFLDKGAIESDIPSPDDWPAAQYLSTNNALSNSESYAKNGVNFTKYGEYVIRNDVTIRNSIDYNNNGVRDSLDKKAYNG